MLITFIAIFFIFTFILLLLFAVVLALFVFGNFFVRAPFVPVPKEVANMVPDLLTNSSGTFYDLGSGDGRVIRAVARKYPNLKCIGIEKALLPYLLAKLFSYRSPQTNIEFIRADIFKTNLSNADVIFVYLLPSVLKDLMPTTLKCVRPGTRILSCDFKLENLTERNRLDVKTKRGHYTLREYIVSAQ